MQKVPIPLSRRLDDLRRRVVPLAVWLLAVVGVLQLVELRGSRVEYLGLAQVTDYLVAAPADGRIAELPVGLYDEVVDGQVLAVFDSQLLTAQILTAAAEAGRLTAERSAVAAELIAQSAELGRDWEKDARRFQMDAADLRIDLLRARVDLESDRVEAERRRVAYERAQSLVEADVLSEAEVEDLRLAQQVVEARITATEAVVERVSLEYAAAVERSREFLAASPEALAAAPRLEALQRAVEVQELRVAEIELARAALVVRAPASGRIRALLATAGRDVVLGQSLLALTPAVGEAVTFYLPPGARREVSVGDRVEVHRAGNGEIAEALVAVLSPTVEELPQQLWRDPAVPEYGRAARLSPMPGLALVPGEPVRVAFREL